MEARPKILLVDDEPDLLEMYREILAQLPSRPDIRTANNGPKALALLEAEPFRVFICDLKMPKMDGLQVLSIVRRKYPRLRTVVLTSMQDEQFRSRVYALGVDLFWQKPGNEEEIRLFLDCLESLLGREGEIGFRGVQSKSLVDIIQLECISQSSVLLRITNGPLAGRIWITGGELVDAETEGAQGEAAFRHILAWKTGNFESLPAEPARPRTIFKSYNALLLESAQALDESRYHDEPPLGDPAAPAASPTAMTALAQLEAVEFVLALKTGDEKGYESRGLENPEPKAAWSRDTLARFGSLAERLAAGPLQQIEGLGPQRHVGLANADLGALAVGWQSKLAGHEVAEHMKKALALWGS